MQINIYKKNRQKVFKVFKVSPLQLIYKDWHVKNLQTGKTSPRALKNTLYESFQLVLACIGKYFEILLVKGQHNLQNTTVNINLYRNLYLPELSR